MELALQGPSGNRPGIVVNIRWLVAVRFCRDISDTDRKKLAPKSLVRPVLGSQRGLKIVSRNGNQDQIWDAQGLPFDATDIFELPIRLVEVPSGEVS
jgi:hypothetical protein